jgi:NAD(P)H-dependent FMN reductase
MLLIVAHAPSETTAKIVAALEAGAADPDAGPIEWRTASPFDVDADDILAAKMVLLFTPTNFGYMSGAMKDLFDRVYESLLERTIGRPYALVVRGRTDASGAVSSVERIVRGLRWRPVTKPLLLVGPSEDAFQAQCEELGMTLAAGLSLGIF